MSSDHLRIVSSQSAPCSVTQLQTFNFAQVDGDLLILHNDQRLTAAEALLEITRLLMPALVKSAPGAAQAGLSLRRVMIPGDMGGDCALEMPDAR